MFPVPQGSKTETHLIVELEAHHSGDGRPVRDVWSLRSSPHFITTEILNHTEA